MSFTSKTWNEDYDKAKALFLDLRQKSEPQRHQLQFLQQCLQRLDQQLYQMEQQATTYNVSLPEINRRRNLVKVLQHHTAQLVEADTQKQGGVIAPSPAQQGPIKDEYRANQEILRQQRLQLHGHDQMLGDIEKGVGRLMNMSKNITEETQLHTRLLNDMDGNVDLAAAELKNEAQHAQKLRKENKNCKLYICVLALLMVIILLLCMGVQ